ncbi:hypothetical protein [Microbacterium sp. NPDC089695]|uniref:hypothetical protein n=1 Tax=Microbacterium sp. NPDC089695 TaxID=3364198 RepID=UPI00382DA522
MPAEHRFLGLDRRTFAGPLAVVVVFLLFTVVIPRIDDAIPWSDPVQAGEQLALTAEVAVTPPVGWNVEEGHRLSADGTVAQSGNVQISDSGVTVVVSTGVFDGTPAQLLAEQEKATAATSDPALRFQGSPATTRTDSGEVGALQQYGSLHDEGLIAAFVIDGSGITLTAQGPAAQMRAAAPQIEKMIASIRALDSGKTS